MFDLAYLDPGAGSILLQALLAGFFGVVMFGKLFWKKLTKPFRKNKEDEDTAATED